MGIPAIKDATLRWETWEAVQTDPLLRDLPFKIETNEHGQVVMSPPPPPRHGNYQFEVGHHLRRALPEGRVVTECPVQTSKGTKVPDVVWFTAERWTTAMNEAQSPVAPEICVEILSPSNTDEEMEEKKDLYFEAGAEEVWFCDLDGEIRFFDARGEIDASDRAPGIPPHISPKNAS